MTKFIAVTDANIFSLARLRPASLFILYTLLTALALSSLGCSQSVDDVGITGPPQVISQPRNLIVNRDLTGTNPIAPVSTSTVLGDHSVGGNALRTSSSSSSYRMLSGVGIE